MSAEYLSIFRFVRAQLTETGGAWGIGCGKSKEIVPGVYAAVTRWFHPYLFLFDFPFKFNYRHSSISEALKAFCFVSVSVILPKQNPVSVKLPFPY